MAAQSSNPNCGITNSNPTASGPSFFSEKPAFGGFARFAESSPICGSFQNSEQAFGSSPFGSKLPLDGAGQPGVGGHTAFGANSFPAFSSSPFVTPGSNATDIGGPPIFSDKPAYGGFSRFPQSSTGSNPFCSKSPLHGFGHPGVGNTNIPAFGGNTFPLFGAPQFATSGWNCMPTDFVYSLRFQDVLDLIRFSVSVLEKLNPLVLDQQLLVHRLQNDGNSPSWSNIFGIQSSPTGWPTPDSQSTGWKPPASIFNRQTQSGFFGPTLPSTQTPSNFFRSVTSSCGCWKPPASYGFNHGSSPACTSGFSFGPGASISPRFGSPSSPKFGMSGKTELGATSELTFCKTTSTACSGVSTPASDATNTSAFSFDASSSPYFGAPSAVTPEFGTCSTMESGATSELTFGKTASTASSVGPSSLAFGSGTSAPLNQSASIFGNSTFGPPAKIGFFGAQSGGQNSWPAAWCHSAFERQHGGSRTVPYKPTPDPEKGLVYGGPSAKLESISAMPWYNGKSHEELRWEDYQRGDNGSPSLDSQFAGRFTCGQPTDQSTSFGTSSFSQAFPSSCNLFGANPLGPGFGVSSHPFSARGNPTFATSNTDTAFGFSSKQPPFGSSSGLSGFGFPNATSFGASSTMPTFAAPPPASNPFNTQNSLFCAPTAGPSLEFCWFPGFGSSAAYRH